jgi:hypothetical protein
MPSNRGSVMLLALPRGALVDMGDGFTRAGHVTLLTINNLFVNFFCTLTASRRSL